MAKELILEILAQLMGFKTKYTDKSGNKKRLTYKDIKTILSINGIDTEQEENLDELISDIEIEQWKSMLPRVQVIKQSDRPVIHINVPANMLDSTYKWILEKENGTIDSGKFLVSNLKKIASKSFEYEGEFLKLEFNLPLNIETGYHTLKIGKNSCDCASMKLIVAPEKCYVPKAVQKNKKVFGPKLHFYNIDTQKSHRIADINDLKLLIKKLALYGGDIIGVGPISQTFVDESKAYNPFLPSNRMFFNTLFLNTDEILKFIEAPELQLEFLSMEFQKKYEELEKAESTDYKAIYGVKFKKYRLLYQSFREFHINNNTPKAKQFNFYVEENRDRLHKIALFRALQDFLVAEDSKYVNWREWPEVYQNPDSESVLQFEKNNSELIQFYEFLQWQTDMQFESAGVTSLENKLGIGICADLPFCVDPNGSELWMNREYFSDKAYIKLENDNKADVLNCPVLLPHKLFESGYSYFIDMISANMAHSGALNLLNLNYFLNPEWTIISDGLEKTFGVNYVIEDLLKIIAIESHKNHCLVITDMKSFSGDEKKLLNDFGIYDKSRFELEEIFDENQLKDYFEDIKSQKNLPEDIQSSHITKIPDSTYRLQFCKDFTFNMAKEIIPYLKKLGISHVYASPILSPRKGSMHGYDVVNHNAINQEAGTIDEFNSFVDELHHHGIGLILDIVPNHMGIGKENKWWMDVLENGQSSGFAHYFDIDWYPVKKELRGKVLLPVLGAHYGDVVTSGQLKFKFYEETGRLTVNYYEHEFPLNPSSYPAILEYRIDTLKTRLGALNKDFLEYLSIITVFKNLPKHTIIEYEKIMERNREKTIALERLSELCRQNYIIKGFIEENLLDFDCSSDNPITVDRVHNLLEEQAYRLAFWRVSFDEINYRRFFDVNDLTAVCVEKPDVFTNTHSFILNLIEDNKIDGLRLDHPDGLLEPVEYYKKLQLEIAKKIGVYFDMDESNLLCSEKLPFYIVAEKILAPSEKLPSNWAIHGTVGYEFLNSVNGLFINSKNKDKFTNIYHRFIRQKINFEEVVIKCKKLIMNVSLTGELNVLSNYLNKISEMFLHSRDYTLNSIRNALIDVIACFPVYRTYISKDEEITKCRDYIKWATGLAKKYSRITDTSIFDFIEKILLLELETDTESHRYKNMLKFTLKFQQYTGPLMAKGFEDTCFYRYNRLIALNEVGGEPSRFGVSVEEFHQANLNRMEVMPNSMLNTSTHDTKRSEDFRARVCVISEIPDEWQKAVKRWHFLNKNSKKESYASIEIDNNDEYLIYQTLVGIWSEGQNENLIERLEEYILKAVREAKVHTSWININSKYEQAICSFIRKILNYPSMHPFWKEFLPLQKTIATAGYINSISQCVLKLTSPGVPDIYQGNEVFRFNLVDPDNRRPVDYSRSASLLEQIQPALDFNPEVDNLEIFNRLIPFESGALKLFYTCVTLNFRHKNSDLFRQGKYIPLEVIGKKSENIVAFARLHNDRAIITVVPRLLCSLLLEYSPLQIDLEKLGNTSIIIPDELARFEWKDIYTKQNKTVTDGKILLSEVLNLLPAAVLSGEMAQGSLEVL